MRKILLLLSAFFILTQTAFAQVVDMRAYSRQHGFKAYQGTSSAHKTVARRQADRPVKTPSAAEKKRIVPSESETIPREQNEPVKNDKTDADQTDEMRRYIQDNPQVIPDL